MSRFALGCCTFVCLFSLGCQDAPQESKELQAAIAEIKRFGGTIQVDDNRVGKPIVAVDCSNKKVGDDVLAGLKDARDLEVLQLARSRVTDEGLKSIQSLTRLRVLTLTDCNITNKGLAYLKGLTDLQDLGLSGTMITDDGLDSLRGLTHLDTLYVKETPVTEDGIKKFQLAVPGARIVH